MDTANDMASLLGKRVFYTANQSGTGRMVIPVIIRNVKSAWGSLRFEITPEHGTGLTWVDSASVMLNDPNAPAVTTVTVERVEPKELGWTSVQA